MWEHFLNVKLSHIVLIATMGIAWGALQSSVSAQSARIDHVEARQSQTDVTLNAQAVTLGRIDQRVSDIWCHYHQGNCND